MQLLFGITIACVDLQILFCRCCWWKWWNGHYHCHHHCCCVCGGGFRRYCVGCNCANCSRSSPKKKKWVAFALFLCNWYAIPDVWFFYGSCTYMCVFINLVIDGRWEGLMHVTMWCGYGKIHSTSYFTLVYYIGNSHSLTVIFTGKYHW